jgi:non-heme chloroperoxidase
MPLLQSGLFQKLVSTRTVGTLFGAAQCGTCPSPAMISVFQEIFAQQDHQALLPIARAFVREDRYPRLGEIQVPTAVIVGAADRTTPRGHAQRLAAGVPGARLITVPEAGHFLNWEAEGPAVLLETIESFQPKSEGREPIPSA